MKIGTVEIKNRVFLAPMAGITDMPFRLLCAEQGAGLVYSEMISAKGIHYNNENTKALLQIDPAERPCGLQLFGSEPAVLGAIAQRLTADPSKINFDLIDINMGCPAPKIVKNGEDVYETVDNDILLEEVFETFLELFEESIEQED